MEYDILGNIVSVLLLKFCLLLLNNWIFPFIMNFQMIAHKLWNNYIVLLVCWVDDDYKDFMTVIQYRAVLGDNFYRMTQH